MAKLKDNIASAANNLLDTIPLATATLSTALVATNSWLVELINEDADFDKVNTLKAKMISSPKVTTTGRKR